MSQSPQIKKKRSRASSEFKSYLDYLIDEDYFEKPVDIETFLTDEYFLGKLTNKGQAIYPYWIDALKKIFSDDTKVLIVLTGAIGIGKSQIAVYAIAYCLYRLMCLRTPWEFFNLAQGGKMGVVFFNLTKSLGDSKGFSVLQSHLMESPWFLQRKNAIVRGSKEQYVELPLFKYLLASPYCFTGDTKVSLLDGRELEMVEIVKELKSGHTLWAYSYDIEKQLIVPGKILDAFKSGVNAELLKITLDNGEVVRCTKNHLFLMRTGEYKKACEIKKDDSLMPLYRQLTDHKVVNIEECGREDVYDLTVEKYHNFALSAGVFVHNSKGFATLGQDIIVGVMDELDSPTESAKQKQRVLQAYEQTVIRFKSRFVNNGSSLGRLFLVSSKQDELSFIETFIAKMKKSGEILVFDVPIWEVKPKYFYKGTKFPVAIGDAYRHSRLIEKEDVDTYVKDGFKVINVPTEFRHDFERDINIALRDIAGESIAGSRKHKLFASEQFIRECFDQGKQDPIQVQTLNVGLKDDLRWSLLLDSSKIRVDKSVPRYIHMDIGVTNDAMGIAMSGISDWKEMEVQQQDGSYKKERLPIVETDFVCRIKAKDGDRIPIHRMREFILDIKSLGYNIKKFTADLRMASEDTLQLLQSAGIDAQYFSVDKTTTPYIDFRNLVYEKRWVFHNHSFLMFELKNLEIINNKVDHPDEISDIEYLDDGDARQVIMKGSKDLADAICGSVVNALYETKPPHTTKEIQEVFSSIEELSKDKDFNPIKLVDREGREIVATKEGTDSVIDARKIEDFFKEIQ
jgi:hypothetical protein